MTERKKRDDGLLYIPSLSKELVNEMKYAKKLCGKFNTKYVNNPKKQAIIIKKLFGKVGLNYTILPFFWCDYGYNIELGDNFFANHNLIIQDSGKVIFGDNVFIGPNTSFFTAGHSEEIPLRIKGTEYAKPIVVGNNVWIGGGVKVMPGVKIGNNSIIGGGSVVVKDIPEGVIACGVPAKVIRNIKK